MTNEISIEQRRTLQQSKQNIRRNGPFVSLVKHNDRVLRAERVDQTLSLQHTVRHVLDARLRARAVLETDRVADFLPKTATDLLCDTLRDGHGGDTTRLGAAYPALVRVACLGEVLDHLRGLAGTGVADDDEYLVLYT